MMRAVVRCWTRFWFHPTSLLRLAAFRVVLVLITFWDFWSYSFFVSRYAKLAPELRTWRPLYILEVLGLGPIDAASADLVFVVGCSAMALALVGLFTRFACFITAVVVLFWTAQVYSFGKPHHDKVAFAFAWMAMPFAPCGARLSLDAFFARMRRVRRGRDPLWTPQASAMALPPMRLTQVSIAFGYFFAGASKLAIVGPGWANGWTLQGIMASFDGYYTELLLPDVLLCRALSVLTLICQLCFPVVLLVPRLRWFFLPVAAGFHVVAWLTMETGPYMALWLLLLVFLPIEKIPAWLAAGFRSGAARAALTFCLAAPFIAVFFIQWFAPYMPAWLACVFIPPILAFVLLLLPQTRLGLVYDESRDRKTVARLAALDWSKRLRFVEASRADDEVEATPTTPLNRTSVLRAALRLPLLMPIAWLYWLPCAFRRRRA